VHLGPFCYYTKLGIELVQLMQCSGAFGNVWVHLGTFHYSMKLDAKLAELMFVQRSRVGSFGNKGI